MLKRKWISQELHTYEDWLGIRDNVLALSPKVCGFDTETTGLRIAKDLPFLFQFGFLHPTNEKLGYTFLVDWRKNEDATKIVEEWHDIAKNADINLGANIKFDLHMLKNKGVPFRDDNLSDLQFFIRYGTDAIQEKYGGASLALKDFAVKYIDINAKYHEKLLTQEKSQKVKHYNNCLRERLQTLGRPPEKYKAKSYTLKVIQNIFKDPLFELNDLDENVKKVYLQWKNEDLPEYLRPLVTSCVESGMIRYDTLSDVNLKKYAHYDIIYLLEGYELLEPIVRYRKNMEMVHLEESLILPFFDMECTGFLADKEYLEDSRIRIKQYTYKQRQRFIELAGEELAIGQHAKVLSLLKDKFKVDIDSTDAGILEQELGNLKRDRPGDDVIEFIEILLELRTLEKWYSTYIIRFQKELRDTDKLYTQISQVGTVSGRVSSDFQQFPKKAIVDKDGNELFHPRRIVKVPNDCKGILYLDYSQVELRFQAMYTILIGHPDLNMCRAYMPYNCHNAEGVNFDYNNIAHIKAWKEDWYYNEEPETKWTPTDIHGATTLEAFKSIGLTKESENFHALRYVGKRVDFSKNYGASLKCIINMFPEYSEEQCKEIDAAYYAAFPGVKKYHEYCMNRAKNFASTASIFGCNYYGVNGHKLRNVLVQGSAAQYLKNKIRAIWEYLRDNNLKSRLQLQIHDELVFTLSASDPPIAKKLKEIMEDWDEAMIPIVAEAEITNTTWADKRELDL